MFFMFAFIALLTIFATCKWSNTYEKLYYKNKTETENESDGDNVNLGDVLYLTQYNKKQSTYCPLITFIFVFSVMLLKKESYQLSF